MNELVVLVLLLLARWALPELFASEAPRFALPHLAQLGERLFAALNHPASRMASFAAAWVVFGWLALATRTSVGHVLDVATLGPAAKDTGACHLLQKSAARTWNSQPKWAPQHADHAERFSLTCPYGGEFVLEDDGILTCTRHGRAPGAVPVADDFGLLNRKREVWP